MLRFICILCLFAAVNSLKSPFSSRKSLRLHDGGEFTCPNAPKCSGEFRSKGCDGNGKIQGGIATVPLLSWWPIKVYRPCPSYLQAGYVYRREGQTLEQVLFSEPSTKMKQMIDQQRKQKSNNEAVTSSTPPKPVADANKDALNDKEEVQAKINELLQEKFGNKEKNDTE